MPVTNDLNQRRREAIRGEAEPTESTTTTPAPRPTRRILPKALGSKLEAALRKAYARDDLRLHGVATATVQALVQLGLADVAARGRADLYVLSSIGEQRAAELMRALLVRRGQAAPPTSTATSTLASTPGEKATFCDLLVAFLADPESGSLTLDLPSAGAVSAGGRVKIDRCGPSKLLLCLAKRPPGH